MKFQPTVLDGLGTGATWLDTKAQMLPAELLRSFAKFGTTTAENIERFLGMLHKDIDLALNMKGRLGKILGKDGEPFSPESRQEIAESIFSSRKTPDLFRGFISLLLASGMAEKYGINGTDTSLILDLYFASCWADSGLPVFSLTHSLAAALLLTEPPPFVPSEFKLPFPAFAIMVPQGLLPFFARGKEAASAETILVHLNRGNDDQTGRTVDILQLDVRSRVSNLWHRSPLAECTSVTREQAAFADVDETLKIDLVDEDFRTIEVSLRILRNLVAWIEAHGRGQHEGRAIPRGAAYGRDSAGNALPTTWVLGREVKLSPELRRAAAEVALGQKHGGPGWKLRMRYCVRGHWRMQACGEGHRERKRIWIPCYWKGPEGGAAWAHVYTLSPTK